MLRPVEGSSFVPTSSKLFCDEDPWGRGRRGPRLRTPRWGRETLMPTCHRVSKTLCSGLLAVALAALAHVPAGADAAGTGPFAIVNRSIVQDRGDWQVEYRLRY